MGRWLLAAVLGAASLVWASPAVARTTPVELAYGGQEVETLSTDGRYVATWWNQQQSVVDDRTALPVAWPASCRIEVLRRGVARGTCPGGGVVATELSTGRRVPASDRRRRPAAYSTAPALLHAGDTAQVARRIVVLRQGRRVTLRVCPRRCLSVWVGERWVAWAEPGSADLEATTGTVVRYVHRPTGRAFRWRQPTTPPASWVAALDLQPAVTERRLLLVGMVPGRAAPGHGYLYDAPVPALR